MLSRRPLRRHLLRRRPLSRNTPRRHLLARWPRAVALAAALGVTAAGALGALGALGASPASAQGVGQQVRAAEMPELSQIGVPAAWPVSKGSGVTVGVLDTGTDAGVPDLAGSVTTGPDFTRGADPPGYQPPHLHGTYIASLIAGHGSGPGRAGGVIGVAPDARILAVRVILDDSEPGFAVYNENSTFANAIPDGIRYAVNHGVTVINMSLGSGNPTRDMREAISYAVARNVVVVASAGNDGTARGGFTSYSYPASFTGVISVAAVGAGGRRASFSDRNASVVVSAPGVNVVGAGPGGEYLSGSGTSPASAFVAGIAALIRSRYPKLPAALVAQAIVASAQHRPAGGYNPAVGFGEVNAADALTAAARLAKQPAAGGLGASARFSASPGPIQVVHRDYPKIVLLAALAVVALLGFLIAVILLALGARRRRPARHEPGSPPGPALGPDAPRAQPSWPPPPAQPGWETPPEQPPWPPPREQSSWPAPHEQPASEAPREQPSWEPSGQAPEEARRDSGWGPRDATDT